MSTRSTRGEATRTSILDAARELLVGEGIERFVLRTIAGCVGITLGNLQYYFATRDDLLAAVIEVEFEQDLAIIGATVGRPRSGRRALADVARGLVEHWCSEGGSVFTTLWMLAAHHKRFAELNEAVYRRFYDALAVLVRAADPHAAEDEVAMRTRLVTSVLDGVAVQFNAGVDLGERDCEALFVRATDVVMAIAITGSA